MTCMRGESWWATLRTLRLTLSSGHATLPLLTGLWLVLCCNMPRLLLVEWVGDDEGWNVSGGRLVRLSSLEGYHEDYGVGLWVEDDWCGDE